MASKGGPEFITVVSGFQNDRVVLHEIDPAHPGGSVIVAGKTPTLVGNTALVRARIRDQWLVEARDAESKKEAQKRADARVEMIEATGDPGASPIAGQFGDNRRWPGSEPTPEEVAADRAPKGKAEANDEVQVPEPPAGDQSPEEPRG